jgi:hypothetical protein
MDNDTLFLDLLLLSGVIILFIFILRKVMKVVREISNFFAFRKMMRTGSEYDDDDYDYHKKGDAW